MSFRNNHTGAIRAFQTLSAMLAIGCSGATNDNVAPPEVWGEQATVIQKPTVAVLTCSVNGTPIGAPACITAADSNSIGGSLKVSSNYQTNQYTDYEIYQMAGGGARAITIPLTQPFEITAQANGEPMYVLRLEIKQGSQTLFQDEANGFGVISVDSNQLR